MCCSWGSALTVGLEPPLCLLARIQGLAQVTELLCSPLCAPGL